MNSTTVSSGIPPYTYQWLNEAPPGNNPNYTPFNGATSGNYTFATSNSTATGKWNFYLQVNDSLGATAYTSIIQITVFASTPAPTQTPASSPSSSPTPTPTLPEFPMFLVVVPLLFSVFSAAVVVRHRHESGGRRGFRGRFFLSATNNAMQASAWVSRNFRIRQCSADASLCRNKKAAWKRGDFGVLWVFWSMPFCFLLLALSVGHAGTSGAVCFSRKQCAAQPPRKVATYAKTKSQLSFLSAEKTQPNRQADAKPDFIKKTPFF